MSIEISKLKARVNTLSNSLDELEAVLEPLFSQTLPETVLNLEPLQQAKLQTDVPYVIYDLVFMYLKLKGIDPKSHPVIGELDRIRQYFDKISKTENPPQRRAEIDKEAANRFIKHAISSVKWTKGPGEEAQEQEPTPSSSRVPVKVTSKMLERQEYEKQLKEKAAAGESEEEGLEVFGEDGEDTKMDVDGAEAPSSVAAAPSPSSQSNPPKRQRPTMDPFAGYEPTSTDSPSKTDAPESEPTEETPAPSASTTQPKPKKKKTTESSKKKKPTKKKASTS